MPAAAILVEYGIQSSGEIDVKQRFDGVNGMQDMPAFGMSLSIPCEYDQVSYYGNGPEENYQDRNSGARLGVFLTTAKESQSQYVIPQECGNHTGTRWVAVYDENATGIRFSGKTPMEFSVLPYTCHELENAGHPYNLPPIHDTVISLFSRKMGLAEMTVGEVCQRATLHCRQTEHMSCIHNGAHQSKGSALKPVRCGVLQVTIVRTEVRKDRRSDGLKARIPGKVSIEQRCANGTRCSLLIG
jgi:hypothetical protein